MYRIAKGLALVLTLVLVTIFLFAILTFPALIADATGSEQYMWLYLLHLTALMYAAGGTY